MKKLFFTLAIMGSLGAVAKEASLKTGEIKSELQEKQYKKIDVSAVDKAALDKIKKVMELTQLRRLTKPMTASISWYLLKMG